MSGSGQIKLATISCYIIRIFLKNLRKENWKKFKIPAVRPMIKQIGLEVG